MSILPTFIIAGAGKSGSTSMWHYLETHPEVCMARIKEPKFFTQAIGCDRGGSDGGPSRSGTFDKGFEWYSNLFCDTTGKKAFGEATMMYWFSKDSPTLIHKYIPDVKLIFILRNPVDRMYSQYWQERKAGQPHGLFEKMVSEEHPRSKRYINSSSYKANLGRYLDQFSRDQMLILLTDELEADPIATVQKVYEFIGVRADFVPSNIEERFNTAAMPKYGALQYFLWRIPRSRMAKITPSFFKAFYGKLRYYVERFNLVKNDYEPMQADMRRELLEFFKEDIDFVECVLGRSLAHWRGGVVKDTAIKA